LAVQSDRSEWARITTMLAESLDLNKPSLRIETLKSSSQNPINWFDQFEILNKKWDSRTRGFEVASYFEDITLQKYKLMKNEEAEGNCLYFVL
jgi:hypothetical protein